MRSYLDSVFAGYEAKYGVETKPTASLAVRFDSIIKAAQQKTRLQVCVLIDEYDSPLQHSWRTSEHEKCTVVYREVFAILKSADQYERFVFIMGITKFTQISLFSVLNNLTNISFLPEYAEICGITEAETHEQLKNYYDGYHFSRRNMTDIYNPFSLINALDTRNSATSGRHPAPPHSCPSSSMTWK